MIVHFDESQNISDDKGFHENVEDDVEDDVEETEDAYVIMCAKHLFNLSSYTPQKRCQICATIKTPLWRRSPEYHTLCNACGIRVKMLKKKHISYIPNQTSYQSEQTSYQSEQTSNLS